MKHQITSSLPESCENISPIFELVIGDEYFARKKFVRGSRVFLSQYGGIPSVKNFRVMEVCEVMPGEKFDPTHLLSIIRFIEMLEDAITQDSTDFVVCSAGAGHRALIDTAFYLGAYMIVRLQCNMSEVVNCLADLEKNSCFSCEEATFAKPNMDMKLVDFWSALKRGRERGWISMPIDNQRIWGMIDLRKYECNKIADMQEVIPSHVVVFKSPKDLGGTKFLHNFLRGTRDFSPSFYLDIFSKMDVSAVVRLVDPHYDARIFTSKGISHIDLDCKNILPTPPVITDFFQALDKAKGKVAVHCKPDLGRSLTMIALYLMRSNAFTAKEAIAWLRMMVPGTVSLEQQNFLCRVESEFRHMALSILLSPRSDCNSSSSRFSPRGEFFNRATSPTSKVCAPTALRALPTRRSNNIRLSILFGALKRTQKELEQAVSAAAQTSTILPSPSSLASSYKGPASRVTRAVAAGLYQAARRWHHGRGGRNAATAEPNALNIAPPGEFRCASQGPTCMTRRIVLEHVRHERITTARLHTGNF